MGFFDDLADGISGLMFDAKIEDGVRGTAQVVAASGYYGHALYQNGQLEVVVEAPGIPATAATVHAVVSRDTWPRPGQVLPALIERANPREVQILWDELPKAGDVAKVADHARAAREAQSPGHRPRRPPGRTDDPLGVGARPQKRLSAQGRSKRRILEPGVYCGPAGTV